MFSMPPQPRKALLRALCRCRHLEAEGDSHEFCFVCLGPRHARDGMVNSPECTSCASLSETERRKRHEYFQVEEPLADVVSALLSDEESSGSEDLGWLARWSWGRTLLWRSSCRTSCARPPSPSLKEQGACRALPQRRTRSRLPPLPSPPLWSRTTHGMSDPMQRGPDRLVQPAPQCLNWQLMWRARGTRRWLPTRRSRRSCPSPA